MHLVRAALAYFGIVFGVGFILGPIRVLWFEPWFGVGLATAIEAPFLLAAMAWAALKLPSRFGVVDARDRLVMGGLAVSMVVLADAVLGRWLRGITMSDQLASLTTPAGLGYIGLLLAFALMPRVLGGSRRVIDA